MHRDRFAPQFLAGGFHRDLDIGGSHVARNRPRQQRIETGDLAIFKAEIRQQTERALVDAVEFVAAARNEDRHGHVVPRLGGSVAGRETSELSDVFVGVTLDFGVGDFADGALNPQTRVLREGEVGPNFDIKLVGKIPLLGGVPGRSCRNRVR